MTIEERINILITSLCNGNKSLFAKTIGVTPSVISNITGERKGNPSFDVIQKILNAFVNVNARWLLTGEGEMLQTATSRPATITEVIYESDPRDAEMIVTKNEMIETQKELISALKQRIKELEGHSTTGAFTSVRSAASTGVAPQHKTTK